jgi:O-antigen ligase
MLFSILSPDVFFKKIPWYIYITLLFIESIAMFFLSINESNRFVGTLGEPNALASFSIFVFPFIFYSIKKFNLKEKIGLIFGLFLIVVILVASGSKSGMIAFAIELFYILLSKTNFSKLKIIGVCLFFYALSYILPYVSQNPYENRVEVWRSAITAGFMKPILGWGFGNTEVALKKSSKIVDLPIQYYYVDSSHNIFLDWWVQGGIIGFLTFVSLIGITIYSFIKTDSNLYLVLFLGLITTLSFNPASVVGLLGIWFLIGKGFSLLPSNHEVGGHGRDV